MPTTAYRLFQLSARVNELKRLDLGREQKDYDLYPCGPVGGSMAGSKTKTAYPELCIYGVSTPLEMPDTGTATVQYKVLSKTTRMREGKTTHSADIEIQSIDPASTKKKLQGATKIKMLGSLMPGMIEFDDRPRNGSGQFSPESGDAPDPHAMRAAYGPGAIAKNVAGVGAAVGAGGLAAARGGSALKALTKKLRR